MRKCYGAIIAIPTANVSRIDNGLKNADDLLRGIFSHMGNMGLHTVSQADNGISGRVKRTVWTARRHIAILAGKVVNMTEGCAQNVHVPGLIYCGPPCF